MRKSFEFLHDSSTRVSAHVGCADFRDIPIYPKKPQRLSPGGVVWLQQ